MICDDKPDFKKSMEKANEILTCCNSIDTFPFSIKAVVREIMPEVKCKTYDKAISYGVDIKDFGSEDAVCMKYRSYKIIFYESKGIVKARIVFSISHELGHLYLGHDLSDKEHYDKYEVETNFFAAQLLMPEQIINEFRRRGKDINEANLMEWFGTSKIAAQKRLETLRKIDFSRRSYAEQAADQAVLLKYKSFIDSVVPINRSYYDPYDEEEMQRERDKWWY